MHLDPLIRDYPAYLDEFMTSLDTDGTRIYLDTSLLMWLVRLGDEARQEFFAWCGGRDAQSVCVPVWAAHELHRHLLGGTVRINLQKSLSEVRAKLDEFTRLASERADDAVCRAKGYTGRIGYVSELELSFEKLNQMANVIDADDAQLQKSSADVIAFVNDHVLSTDIEPIVDRVSSIGAFRYSHLMPPGFQDKKDENRFGDVIIWEELVADVEKAGPNNSGQARDAVLVSRDKKTDWVSAAHMIKKADGTIHKANRDQGLDVTLAHPLLVHEFRARANGSRLYIATPSFLASALSYRAKKSGTASLVSNWLAASYRPDKLEVVVSLVSPPAGAPAAHGAPQPANEPSEDDQDLQSLRPDDVMAPSVGSDVRGYERATGPEQADILTGWLASLSIGSLPTLKFGRVLAELAKDDAPGFASRLPGLLQRLSETMDAGHLNRVVLAIITSAYFNQFGEALRRPLAGLGTIALTLETDGRYDQAFQTLGRFLMGAGSSLPYFPGSGRNQVRFVIDVGPSAGTGPRAIRDIRIGDQPAMIDPLDKSSARRLTLLLDREPSAGCTGLDLRTLVAREYLIPLECLNSSMDKKKFSWPPDAGLVVLDTESEGGLSSLAEDVAS